MAKKKEPILMQKIVYIDIIEYKYSDYKKIDRDCLKQINKSYAKLFL